MGKNVLSHSIRTLKFRAAGFALDTPFIGMNKHMRLQVIGSAKCLSAFGSLEWPFAGMYPLVNGKRTLLSEIAAACVALVLNSFAHLQLMS